MHLSQIGEFGFINRLSEKFKDLTIPSVMGIGDDCAIIPMDENRDYAITTDMLVENIHFIRSKITPFELGYKTLAVNLSDVAAMGAKPFCSFLSVAIPPEIEVDYLDQLLDGYKHLSEKYNVLLLGGDTTRTENAMILNVTVIGIIEKNKARLRSMAQKDDIVCVTGYLGDSGGGLKIILDDIPLNNDAKYLLKCHNCPEPAVNEGIWLANQDGVNAMMDISDGIASDLKHILKASKKSAAKGFNSSNLASFNTALWPPPKMNNWQRDCMVGSSLSQSAQTKTKMVSSGGSSSIFNKLLAASTSNNSAFSNIKSFLPPSYDCRYASACIRCMDSMRCASFSGLNK